MRACRFFARIGNWVLAILVPVLVSVLATQAKVAYAAGDTITVLGIEATDGAPESVAGLVTDALRQRATSERGMRLVPGRDLVDIKIMFSCPDEAPTCMADAGKNLGVSRMIFGSVKRAPGESYVMTLKMLDVGRRQVVAFVGEPLSRSLATPGAIRVPVDKWFATLTGQSTTGTVRVRGDIPGISIALDGAPMGVLGARDLVLPNVPAGKREVVGSKAGYSPVHKDVTVVAGGTIDVTLEISSGDSGRGNPGRGGAVSGLGGSLGGPEGQLSSSMPREQGNRDALKWGSWATAAAGLASFGLAIKFAIDVNYYNEQLDPYRRFPCAADKAMLCDANGAVARKRTMAEQTYIDALTQDGKDFQTYEFIALGVGGAFAIASGVLFYFGYFADDSGASSAPRADIPRLQVAPFVTSSTKGFSARLTF